MKNTLTIIALLFISILSAQEFNQFDAENKRHGKWQKKYEGSNQLRYQGQFDHGQEIGIFNFFHKQPKGKHASCIKEFKLNSKISFVKYYTTHGLLLEEGKMKGKKRIGAWISYDRKTKAIVSNEPYVDGLLDGTVKSFYPDGKILKTEEFKVGKKTGGVILYAPNGKIVSKYLYTNDRQDGPFVKYDSNGKKVVEGKYNMGKKVSVWKYYENGKLVKTKDYTKSNNPKKKGNGK